MSTPPKSTPKPKRNKTEELPDALLDKVAGGGQQGTQTKGPVTGGVQDKKDVQL